MSEKNENSNAAHCPSGCPFLEINYFEETQKIPYHCELFDTFLAFDGNILRCSECVGHEHSIKEQGLNFINAYVGTAVNRNVTKLGFAKLFPSVQRQFVTFLKRVGAPVGIPSTIQNISMNDLDKVQKYLIQELNKSMTHHQSKSSDVHEMEVLLKKATDDSPDVMDKKSSQLLLNLFQVLDSSERDLLKCILRNPALLDSFMAKLKYIPHNSDLLKNVRLELERITPEVVAAGNAPVILPQALQSEQQKIK